MSYCATRRRHIQVQVHSHIPTRLCSSQVAMHVHILPRKNRDTMGQDLVKRENDGESRISVKKDIIQKCFSNSSTGTCFW